MMMRISNRRVSLIFARPVKSDVRITCLSFGEAVTFSWHICGIQTLRSDSSDVQKRDDVINRAGHRQLGQDKSVQMGVPTAVVYLCVSRLGLGLQRCRGRMTGRSMRHVSPAKGLAEPPGDVSTIALVVPRSGGEMATV